jgi:hypothetical protein
VAASNGEDALRARARAREGRTSTRILQSDKRASTRCRVRRGRARLPLLPQGAARSLGRSPPARPPCSTRAWPDTTATGSRGEERARHALGFVGVVRHRRRELARLECGLDGAGEDREELDEQVRA